MHAREHASSAVRGAALATLALLALAAPAGAENPRPATIPALQQWSGASGTFALRPESRIVVDAADREALVAEAEQLADDLGSLTGRRPAVEVREPAADGALPPLNAGDVHLALGASDPVLADGGYELAIGDAVSIRAPADAGVFYGTRTLLQLLRAGGTAPRGLARDWPRYPERGLMVDNGRKHFTLAWLERRVRELAYLKLNRLHLHLSDNQGFRIESESHPEVVTAPYLTKDEVGRLLDVARRHHVTVVPEIDMPGHMEAALRAHPELWLRDSAGRASPDKLDVTLPAARAFARDLIEEHLALFPGPYWHGGSDEYFFPMPEEAGYAAHPQLERYARERHGPDAVGKDALLDFVNWMNELVRGHGRTLRTWHDGLGGGSAVAVSPDVVVEWWSNHAGPSPQELLARGHRVLNAGWFPTYYVNGPLGTVRPDMRTAYESWRVSDFYGPFVADETLAVPPHRLDPAERAVTGSLLHVWNDDPEAATEEEIEQGIAIRLRVIGQKTWESPPFAPTFAEFERLAAAVGGAP